MFSKPKKAFQTRRCLHLFHPGSTRIALGSILDQSIVFAFIRNSFWGLARPITRPGGFYNLIELDRGVDSDLTEICPLEN